MKTVIKRFMSLLLCFVLLLPTMNFVSADTKWDAECVLGKQNMFKNASVDRLGTSDCVKTQINGPNGLK